MSLVEKGHLPEFIKVDLGQNLRIFKLSNLLA
jgi:hypothetical protein